MAPQAAAAGSASSFQTRAAASSPDSYSADPLIWDHGRDASGDGSEVESAIVQRAESGRFPRTGVREAFAAAPALLVLPRSSAEA
jgi:hypothetical protein